MEPFSTQQNTEKVKEVFAGLEGWLAPLFADAPHLPEKGRKVITDIAPWIVIIFGVLGAIAIVTGGLMVALATLFSGGHALLYIAGYLLPMVCSAISIVLMLMAFPGLKAMQKKGWNLVFYSQVVSVVGGVLGVLSGNFSMLLGTVIGALIGFWLLFEVRSHYTK